MSSPRRKLKVVPRTEVEEVPDPPVDFRTRVIALYLGPPLKCRRCGFPGRHYCIYDGLFRRGVQR